MGWQCYPEQGNWDILCVDPNGDQYGVQAKLTAKYAVLAQALPEQTTAKQLEEPNFRIVLVGRFPVTKGFRSDFMKVARNLRVIVVCGTNWDYCFGNRSPISIEDKFLGTSKSFYRSESKLPVWIPPFIPDIPAGVPSPKTLSRWKLVAIEVDRIYELRGYVCLDDVRKSMAAFGAAFVPHTLLNRFYRSTGKRIVGTRQAQWIRRGSPLSEVYPEAVQK